MLLIHPPHECMYPVGQHQENLFDFFSQDSESTGKTAGKQTGLSPYAFSSEYVSSEATPLYI